MAKQERLQIDAEKFAYQYLNTINIELNESTDLEGSAKQALAAFLSAYYLADRFNSQENQFFADPDKDKKPSSYLQILSELNKY